jgi:hypothetical protein
MEKITFEIPYLNKFIKLSATYDELQPVLERIKRQALERAQDNAPIDTGNFRDSIEVNFSLEDDSIVLDFGSSDNPLKVVFLHEAEYQLGPHSLQAPLTPEGGVGNKFFTRVVDFWSDTWINLIVDAILESGDAEFRKG